MAIKHRENGQSVTRANIGGGGGGSVSDFQVNYTISMDNTNRVVNEPIIVKAGTGDFTVSSSDSTVVTASVNNTTKVITLEGLKYGSAVITVTMAASGSYEACTKSIEVTSRVFIPTQGSSYVLGSGAHTSGSALPEVLCLDVDLTNMKAVMQSKGLYHSTWPGSGELDLSTYMGDLNTAVDDAYLPRAQGGLTETTTTPTGVSVFNGSAWTDEFGSSVLQILKTAPLVQNMYGTNADPTSRLAWYGTAYNDTKAWYRLYTTGITNSLKTYDGVICPTFILDLTKVKLHGTQIVHLSAGDMPEFVAFNSTESDAVEKICDILDAADNGDIYLGDYWDVGDTREITVGAWTGGGSTAHAQQNRNIVISRFSSYEGCGGHVEFDFEDCFDETQRMNSSNTNVGGYDSSEMYTTTLPALVNAMPDWIKTRMKTFNVKASSGGASTTIETVTNNKLALRSEMEIANTYNYSIFTEGTQVDYYKTAANRIKKVNGVATHYYLRSPGVSGSRTDVFDIVQNGGGIGMYSPSTAFGLSPFFVM